MLVIELSKIGPEGLDLDTPLVAGEVHVQGEESFALTGGTLRSLVECGDEETVHVRGHLAARLGLQCGRCLEPFPLAVEQELDLFYLAHQADQEEEEEDEVELSDRDMVVAYYDRGRLDLGEMIREQLFLAVPMKRLCREDCRGLCPHCGANRNVTDCACRPEETDPRLAPLKRLLDGSSS